MKRVICHWSEGNYKANSTDLEHYHILVEGDGTVRGGDHTILDNLSTSDGNYAAHTLNTNTGSIGVACCCMVGCQESPFIPGSQPMKKSQWDVMIKVVAELCQFYGIPVTPTTVLGHGEVQTNLGITQKGKWDPMVWPWNTAKTRAQVGAALRNQVAAALAKLGRSTFAVRATPIPTVAAAAPDGDSYRLRSPLLANDPTLCQIAETSLVLVPPEHPKPVSGIEAIQEAINRLTTAGVAVPRVKFGPSDKFRGWFGPQTARALRIFQRLTRIDVDAKIGDDTLRALDNALVSAGVGGLMQGASAGQPKALRVAATKPAAGALIPARKFIRTLAKVFNRGSPKPEFLEELVAWGKSAPEKIFVDQPGNKNDVYASVIKELGPFKDITHRKACMLEVMRVLAGFESSWKWTEGVDTSRESKDTPTNSEAGAWQVSADSLRFGQDLKDLVARKVGNLNGIEFQRAMKADHPLAMEYIARLVRHTRMHNGPLYKGNERSRISRLELRGKEQSIYPWLSRDAVAEFQAFLTPQRLTRRRITRTSRRTKKGGRSLGISAKRRSGGRKVKKAANRRSK
ncbi:MAG TPA: N-acetylmuramoyl-L-alanine amidase [Candidatus Udaeobacter sp.]|jgi:peptidoglycan hydrolase-like protein with peptidoglycan-binding domain